MSRVWQESPKRVERPVRPGEADCQRWRKAAAVREDGAGGGLNPADGSPVTRAVRRDEDTDVDRADIGVGCQLEQIKGAAAGRVQTAQIGVP